MAEQFDFARELQRIKVAALFRAAKDYVGQAAGAAPGIRPASKVDFRNRFTRTNSHGFAALSNNPRFVAVQKKDGNWVGFKYPGYATWKKTRFGLRPILVRTGAMVADIRARARVMISGIGSGAHAVAHFRLSEVASRHYRGDGKLPKRDPISPNAADKLAFRERAIQIFKDDLARLKARPR